MTDIAYFSGETVLHSARWNTRVPHADPVDRLILDEAAELIDGADVVLIDLPFLALSLGAAPRAADNWEDELQFPGRPRRLRQTYDSAAFGRPRFADAEVLFGAAGLEGAEVVLLRLPKSLDRLADIAATIANYASPSVRVIAGGRTKYMTLAMNDVLGASFGEVHASLARQKSRVLHASSPKAVELPQPKREYHAELDLEVVAWGGVFAGTSFDIGTRAMLDTFDSLPDYDVAVDFGCGTGILAAQLKRRRPSALVIGSDISKVAARSAQATMDANGLDVTIVQDSGLSSRPNDSVDLMVLNPPFHDGGGVSTGPAYGMVHRAGMKLKPGGELRTVFNNHLPYQRWLTERVGPTRVISRTPKFTVTTSTKAAK